MLFFWGISIVFIDRPALLAIVPFILAFRILNKRESLVGRDLAMLALLEILWVNLHGSWGLLPGMVLWRTSLRALQERRFYAFDWLAILLVVSATLINPFGFEVWDYLAETASISRQRNISEWEPTLFAREFLSQTVAYCLLALLVLWRALANWRSTRWWSPFYALLILGFVAIRHTVWPFLSLLVYLREEDMLPLSQQREESRSFLNTGIVSILVCLTMLLTPTVRTTILPYLPESKDTLFTSNAPATLAAIIRRENDPRPIFNQFEVGSFLIYALPNKIYVDTRNIIFSEADFRSYHAITRGEPAWDEALEKFGFGWVLVDANDCSGLLAKLGQSKRWIKRGQERSVVLYQEKLNRI
jgi:hypothetical protein